MKQMKWNKYKSQIEAIENQLKVGRLSLFIYIIKK